MEFYNATKLNLKKIIDDQQRLYFSCSYILFRDDEISIKFRVSQKTVKWISQTGQIPDMYSWSNFDDEYYSFYSFNNIDVSKRFTYTKADYIHIASSLSYMMIEHLLIYPCDILVNNQYWDVFGCSIPFQQDQVMCSKPKRCKNMFNFLNMNGLMNHFKKYKYYHHMIVHTYI